MTSKDDNNIINWLLKAVCFFILFIAHVISFQALSNPLDYQYFNPFRLESFSLEQGLSQSVAYRISQDKSGFIWIGTENGLNRFDGYEFKHLFSQRGKEKSLPSNYITSIVTDINENNLWIGTSNGIALIDAAAIEVISNFNSKKIGWVYNIQVTANGVYIATENGLFLLDRQSDKISRIDTQLNDNGRDVTDIALLDDLLWLVYSDCIYSLSVTTNKFNSYCELQEDVGIKDIVKIKQFDSKLFVLTSNKIFEITFNNNKLSISEHVELKTKGYHQDFAIDQHSIWIATDKGLYHFDRSLYSLDFISDFRTDSKIVANNDVISVYLDRQGMAWAGVYGEGLYLIKKLSGGIERILPKFQLSESTPSNIIHGILLDQSETIWMDTYGAGLVTLSLLDGSMQALLVDAKNHPIDSMLYTIWHTDDNEVWVSGADGMYFFSADKKEPISRAIFDINGNQFDKFVLHIYQSRSGDIYFATDDGLYKVLPEQSSYTRLVVQDLTYLLPVELINRSRIITKLHQDRKGRFWVASYSGVAYGDLNKGSWKLVKAEENNFEPLSDAVLDLLEDKEGHIWLATEHGVLILQESQFESFMADFLSDEDGLTKKAVYGIIQDRFGDVWLSTNSGLLRFKSRNGKVITFGRDSGISSLEFNTSATYTSDWGYLYFGSINGVTVINPAEAFSFASKSMLRITDLEINDRSIVPQYSIGNTIEATSSDRIELKVTDLDYKNINAKKFRYRILPYFTDWQDITASRKIVIQGLMDGDFTVQIQSFVDAGSRGTDPVNIPLKINTPLISAQNIIYGILILLLLTIIFLYFFMRAYYHRLMSKREYQLKLESLRQKEIKIENMELKSEVVEKNRELENLRAEINQLKEDNRLRELSDPVTGYPLYSALGELYRVDGIGKFMGFNLFAKITFSGLEGIFESLGVVSFQELKRQLAKNLNLYMPSNANIVQVSDYEYLVLLNFENEKRILEQLIRYQNQLSTRKFSVSNGISHQLHANISILIVEDETVSELQEINDLVSLCSRAFGFALRTNERLTSCLLRGKGRALLRVRSNQEDEFEFAFKNQNLTFTVR